MVSCDGDDYPGAAPYEITAQYGNKLADGTRANLTLTYSGEELIGKSVNLETNDSRTATLTLLNVLPHEAETSLPITLAGDNKGGYTFSGSGKSTLGTTFNYTGTVQKGSLVLDLKDVQIPANPLTTAGKLEPVTNIGPTTDSIGKVKPDDIFETTWMTEHYSGSATLVIEGDDLIAGLSPFLESFLGAAAGNLVRSVLNEVRFGADGNITADYAGIPNTMSMEEFIGKLMNSGIINRPASDWKASPTNLASYYVVDDAIYVTPNVDMIIEQIQKSQAATRSIFDFIGSLTDVYAMLNKWSTTGIKLVVKKTEGYTMLMPFYYTQHAGDYTITISKEELEPLFALVKSLPAGIKNISLGTVPPLSEMTVGTLTDVLSRVTQFDLTIYFSVKQK